MPGNALVRAALDLRAVLGSHDEDRRRGLGVDRSTGAALARALLTAAKPDYGPEPALLPGGERHRGFPAPREHRPEPWLPRCPPDATSADRPVRSGGIRPVSRGSGGTGGGNEAGTNGEWAAGELVSATTHVPHLEST
ncbi:hypothetical protein V5P93_005078 [Actinokineospora auranticolor]|uniref:Uncharacterized protein n=1 Tax=Actinokineospora auranticolor TaxID=155976 RepID=A0A2S6GK54_9PSEU|nr:hypothetical protein [Actinokineospora auranticolor]PPK65608.1 hypothetical protein CLV40_11392 [Actinokineospora auranticolor]